MDLSTLRLGPKLRGVESSSCVGKPIICLKTSPGCKQNIGHFCICARWESVTVLLLDVQIAVIVLLSGGIAV